MKGLLVTLFGPEKVCDWFGHLFYEVISGWWIIRPFCQRCGSGDGLRFSVERWDGVVRYTTVKSEARCLFCGMRGIHVHEVPGAAKEEK